VCVCVCSNGTLVLEKKRLNLAAVCQKGSVCGNFPMTHISPGEAVSHTHTHTHTQRERQRERE